MLWDLEAVLGLEELYWDHLGLQQAAATEGVCRHSAEENGRRGMKIRMKGESATTSPAHPKCFAESARVATEEREGTSLELRCLGGGGVKQREAKWRVLKSAPRCCWIEDGWVVTSRKRYSKFTQRRQAIGLQGSGRGARHGIAHARDIKLLTNATSGRSGPEGERRSQDSRGSFS